MLKSVERSRLHELYINAFYKTLLLNADNSGLDCKEGIKKLITYGVKAVNIRAKPEVTTRAEAEYNFQFAEIIKTFLSGLTAEELINLFPIQKKYDGDRWGSKDYFYTRDYLKTLDPEKPIGSQIDDFLWEYMNTELHLFLVNLYGTVSDLRRLEGRPGLMEQWAQEQDIKVYSLHKDSQGKQYMLDGETGKTLKIRPKRHLKVVRQ